MGSFMIFYIVYFVIGFLAMTAMDKLINEEVKRNDAIVNILFGATFWPLMIIMYYIGILIYSIIHSDWWNKKIF